MAQAGDTFINRAGEQIIFRRTTQETQGELLEIEVAFRANASPPPAHYHPFQTERFQVLQGAIHTVIGGQTRVYMPGEEFHTPAGVTHAMYNTSADIGRVLWQIRPALQTEALFEMLWSLGRDGKTNHNGVPHLLQMAVLLQTYQREFRLSKPPYPVQRVLWGILGTIGRLKGLPSRYVGPRDSVAVK